ncbi:MAG: hypothetical protein ACKVXR_18605 [Planctomycetota bacterium]
MKTGLVAAAVAALLLLGSLAYWNTRPPPGSAPEIQAREDPPVLESARVALEAAEPVSELEIEPGARSEAPVPPAPEPKLEADMADRSGTPRAEVFAKKYAGVSAADRAAAAEFLQLRLERDFLTPEGKVELGHELEWLATHPAP